MKKTYSLFQQYIARLLLIGLCLQSCGGGFGNNPLIPTAEEQIAFIQTNTQEIITRTRANIQPLADQVLTAEGGHLVTFYKEAGELRANVAMNAPQGFSKSYEGLDVCIEQGAELSSLYRLGQQAQQRRIHFQSAQDGNSARVIIYKDAGLMGGDESEDEEEPTYEEWLHSDHGEKERSKEEEDIPQAKRRRIEKLNDKKVEENGKYENDAQPTINEPIKSGNHWIYDVAKADYEPGKLHYKEEKDKNTLATLAYFPPIREPEQCMGIYEPKEELQVLPEDQEPEETVLMRIIPGKDGRTRVSQTTEWPYLFNGQLDIKFSFGSYGGSGILVGPRHILTAAHNVYNSDKAKKYPRQWAKSITVRLGLNDNAEPYGAGSAIRFYAYNEWIQKKDPNYDLALLVLENAIGLNTGWSSLLAATDKELQDHQVSIAGYPHDKGFKQMWTMAHMLKQVYPERFRYEIDTEGGQSGSGIILEKWGNPYVVGVHTNGTNFHTGAGNIGCRLSYAKAKQVIQWIEETMSTQQDTSNLPYSADVIAELTDGVIDDLVTQSKKGSMQALAKFLDAGNKGHIYAQLALAKMYLEGCIFPKDIIKAIEILKKLDKKKYAKARVKLGDLYWNPANGQERINLKAKRLYKKAAEQGDAEAQVKLGSIYYNGPGVARDDKKAFEWYKKAAEQGLAEAQFYLGNMFEYGDGVERDVEEAFKWYQKAAGNGYEVSENTVVYVAYVLASDKGMQTLHWTAMEGHKVAVSLLIKEGDDINGTDHSGYTALHLAAEKGHLEIVDLLLQSGAEVDAVNNDGYTALYKAVSSGHTDVVRLLLEHNTDVNIKDTNDLAPLHVAVDGGYEEIVNLLLARGADVNIKDKTGIYSPLYLAILGGYTDILKTDIVKQLIEYGADIESKNSDGDTLLHIAIQQAERTKGAGYIEIIKLLIDKGADLDAKNKENTTAREFLPALGIQL